MSELDEVIAVSSVNVASLVQLNCSRSTVNKLYNVGHGVLC